MPTRVLENFRNLLPRGQTFGLAGALRKALPLAPRASGPWRDGNRYQKTDSYDGGISNTPFSHMLFLLTRPRSVVRHNQH